MSSLLLIAVYILTNAALLLTASRIINGVTIPEDPLVLVMGGALLWVSETVIKPILDVISLPIIAVTFGLFRAVIAFAVLGVMIYLLPELSFESRTDLLLLALFMAIFGSLARSLISLLDKS